MTTLAETHIRQSRHDAGLGWPAVLLVLIIAGAVLSRGVANVPTTCAMAIEDQAALCGQ